jgi:O-antigen/teichoic acid export membrane protein
MTLFDKLKYSGTWQAIETVIMVLTQFLYLAVMARILNKADFGLMAIANSFVVIGNIFAESGMGAALIQKRDMTDKHVNAALQGNILLGIILLTLFFGLSSFIASFFKLPDLENLIKVIAVSILISSVSSVPLGILLKEFRFKEKALITTFSVLIAYTLGISLAIKGYGVWSLVYASLLQSILQITGYFYFSRIRLIGRLCLQEWKELLPFGFGIVLLKISNYIENNGINLALGKIFNSGLLGVFERTFQLKTLPSQYLGNILDSIMFPAMSEIQDEKDNLFKIYQFSLGVVNTILMPVALYLIFFSKEIVSILLGNSWSEAAVPLQIMFVVLPFSASGRMADSVIRAKGMVYKNVVRKFIYVVILLVSTTYGAYKYGLKGAAAGVTLSYFFNYVIMLFLVRNIFKKTISEIFLSPVLSGLKLTLALLLVLIITTTLLNTWNTISILYFLVLSFFLSVAVVILIWKKPEFFGEYFSGLLNRFKVR